MEVKFVQIEKRLRDSVESYLPPNAKKELDKCLDEFYQLALEIQYDKEELEEQVLYFENRDNETKWDRYGI